MSVASLRHGDLHRDNHYQQPEVSSHDEQDTNGTGYEVRDRSPYDQGAENGHGQDYGSEVGRHSRFGEGQ